MQCAGSSLHANGYGAGFSHLEHHRGIVPSAVEQSAGVAYALHLGFRLAGKHVEGGHFSSGTTLHRELELTLGQLYLLLHADIPRRAGPVAAVEILMGSTARSVGPRLVRLDIDGAFRAFTVDDGPWRSDILLSGRVHKIAAEVGGTLHTLEHGTRLGHLAESIVNGHDLSCCISATGRLGRKQRAGRILLGGRSIGISSEVELRHGLLGGNQALVGSLGRLEGVHGTVQCSNSSLVGIVLVGHCGIGADGLSEGCALTAGDHGIGLIGKGILCIG